MKGYLYCFSVTLAVAMIATGPARAVTFMSDTFSYPDGDLTVYDGTGDNVSGGAWKPHSGTGFPIPVEVSSEQAVVVQGNPASEDVNRQAIVGGAVRTIELGETWYYAALVTVEDTRTDPQMPLEQDSYFMHLKDNGNGFRARAYVTDPSTGVGGAGFTFGLSATSGGLTSTWPTDLNFGQQYKIVGSYAVETGESHLWVDPTDSSSPSLMDTGGGLAVIEALAMRQDFVSAGNTFTVLVDSVALGNDFDSVMRNAMNGSNIPEPSTIALALLLVAGGAISRRSL